MLDTPIENHKQTSWLDRPILSRITLNWETIIFSVILVIAIITRFYDLGARVMSHDETSHVYFSWLFSRGSGYAHDPVTHGPFQFHVVGLTYFLLGDNDTTSRIPAALFSIAAVYFAWHFRRYLGRAGALVGALLLTISPYILYYGRYVRNEAFVVLFGLMTIWAILRYLETGKSRYLYWLTIATVLHFTTKETSFIYQAQALLFLGLYFVYRITGRSWHRSEFRSPFLIALIVALIFAAIGGAFYMYKPDTASPLPSTLPVEQSIAITQDTSPAESTSDFIPYSLFIAAAVSLGIAIYLLIAGYTMPFIRQERSFDLVMLMGTLVLPQLSPFIIDLFGWKIPVNASEVKALEMVDLLRMGSILVPMMLLSVAIGLWWNRRQWAINAAIWYGIFTVLYTSLFTNGAGFFTGMVGSLGYWLSQQEVNRGSQPVYYYALLQVPFYEFLPALGTWIALGIALLRQYKVPLPPLPVSTGEESAQIPSQETPPTLPILLFWSFTSILAYSIAGEKMPWLTVHITLPMILAAAWAIGYLIDTMDWTTFRKQNGWIAIALLAILLPSSLDAIGSLLGNQPPFAGQSLEQLSDTASFTISAVAAIASAVFLARLMKDWAGRQIRHIIILAFLAILTVVTARSAFLAAFIHYDQATEYLVYAHSAPGPKIALAQIEEISRRTTGGLEMVVAYDSDTTYPYWWYLRNFPNQRFYGSAPTRDLRDAPVILVGDDNFGKIEPIVGQAYYRFDYIRLWWPNQDYFNLTFERIKDAIIDPQMRTALIKIWLYRDYTLYAQLTEQNITLDNWYPSDRMRLYIRKDVVAQLWDYGTTIAPDMVVADPYEGKQMDLTASKVIGAIGTEPGQLQNPRDVAIAPDGSLYIADTNNHRIQHVTQDGAVLHVWGSFADVSKGAAQAPGGTFYEPWAVAVGIDGSVYVADTWNHRIQHFTAEGEFINTWGYFGTADTPFAIWGPRDIAIDPKGHVYVTDTGNKRVVIYDAMGNFINQFGSAGYGPGQLDEPVGIAVDNDSVVYIADTWNQRIQVMSPDGVGGYSPLYSLDLVAWYGQSLENKPYIAVDSAGNVFITDPEGYRVLRFNNRQEFAYYWGDFGFDLSSFNIPNGLFADAEGNLWVADSGNHRILRFSYTR